MTDAELNEKYLKMVEDGKIEDKNVFNTDETQMANTGMTEAEKEAYRGQQAGTNNYDI